MLKTYKLVCKCTGIGYNLLNQKGRQADKAGWAGSIDVYTITAHIFAAVTSQNNKTKQGRQAGA